MDGNYDLRAVLVDCAVISGWAAVFCVVKAWEVVFCGARSVVFSVLDIGGARFPGIFGVCTRIARAMLDWFVETPFALSRLRCFILRSPFCILVNSFLWLRILASVDFSSMRGPCLFIYLCGLVLRSSLVPNFAISLLQSDTSDFGGSWITKVY